MDKKKIIICAAIVFSVVFLTYKYLNKECVSNIKTNKGISSVSEQNISTVDKTDKIDAIDKKNKKSVIKKEIKNQTEQDNTAKDDKVVKANLYNEMSSSVMPLSAITELGNLPQNIQTLVSDIAKSGNIYMLNKIKDKLLIISDNPENIRHGIEFTEVSITNGHQIKTTLGYNDKIKDSQNDIWEYNNETHQPVRHTKYNSDGDMEFVEVWNYDENDPVKYEMKDSAGKVISMRKETLNGGTDLRVEHLLYDKDGNTRINVSTTYDGDDIKRFTYYNADKVNESGSIFSEYSDGQKTKETVYTSDLKVKNTYTSDYKDGNREDIIIWDNQNLEVKKYIPKEDL